MLKTVNIKKHKDHLFNSSQLFIIIPKQTKNTPKTRGSFSERIVLKHDMKNIEPGKRIAACE